MSASFSRLGCACRAGAIALIGLACRQAARDQPDAGAQDDAAVNPDAATNDAEQPPAPLPGNAIDVASSGNDANDGVTAPVRTIKRAISTAAAHPEITSIRIAPGIYDAASGEVFPYTVPSNVTVSGPLLGGVMLIGNDIGSAFILGVGKLKDLELASFGVAVVARGLGEIENVHVKASRVAVHEETTATLTATRLEISGAPSACATGIELVGDATLVATDLTTVGLGVCLDVEDHGTATVMRASVMGDNTCPTNTFHIISDKTFTLTDSTLRGSGSGVLLLGSAMPLEARLANVVIRDVVGEALGGGRVNAHVTGGELSGGAVGLDSPSGTWILDGVAFRDNDRALRLSAGTGEPIHATIRNCTFSGEAGGSGNHDGVYMTDFVSVDLGTDASPGHNTFQLQQGVPLVIEAELGQVQINAIGNTWKPLVQGADNSGNFTAGAVIKGPVPYDRNNNVAIRSGLWSVKL